MRYSTTFQPLRGALLFIGSISTLALFIFLYCFVQPLTTTPFILPFGIVSRSNAEFIATQSSGRLRFQEPVEISSSLSMYRVVLQEIGIHQPAQIEQTPNTFVWVVQIHGMARFLSPEPDAVHPVQAKASTHMLIIGITGDPHLEVGK